MLEELLNACCDYPDDIHQRLVTADWLDEHDGSDRAEFIRIQVELFNLPSAKDCDWGVGSRCKKESCRWCSLRSQEMKLLEEHGIRWLRNEYYSKVADPSVLEKSAEFRRGFLEKIKCTSQTWLTHGPELVRAVPVTMLLLTDKEPTRVTHRRGGMSYRYAWFQQSDNPHSNRPHQVPDEFLPKRRVNAPTIEDANAVLSRYAIRWARNEHRENKLRKLPDWTPAENLPEYFFWR